MVQAIRPDGQLLNTFEHTTLNPVLVRGGEIHGFSLDIKSKYLARLISIFSALL